MSPTRLIIVEDHKLLRETWALFLNSDPLFSVIAHTATAEEGIDLCKQLKPDIVLLDINLPGINGIDAVPLIRKFSPGTKILGVSMYAQTSFVKKMMQSGASGYLTKNAEQQEMKDAIIALSHGKKYISNQIKNLLAEEMTNGDDKVNVNALSVREIEIINLVKQGYSSKEISAAKSISAKTVEVHRYNILKKLKLRSTTALVNYFRHVDLF